MAGTNFPRFNRFRRNRGDDGNFTASKLYSDLGSQLAAFKTVPILSKCDCCVASIRPFLVGACQTCTRSASSYPPDSIIAQHGLINVLVTKFVPLEPDSLVGREDSVKLEDLKKAVGDRQGHIQALDDVTEKVGETSELLRFFSKLDISLPSKSSSLMERINRWLFNLKLRMMNPSGIICHPGHLEVLAKCMVSGNPMVFVAKNQSPMDAAMVQLVLDSIDLNPVVVLNSNGSKEGKCIRPFSWQDQEDNEGYSWAVQQQVLETMLSRSTDFLLFLETDYQPTLNACNRQTDLLFLQALIEALSNEDLSDINIVPVSITYDGSNGDQSGLLNTQSFGSIRIDFDEPLSLKELSQSFRNNYCLDDEDQYATPQIVKYLVSHVLWTLTHLKRQSLTDVGQFLKSSRLFPGQTLSNRIKTITKEMRGRGVDTAFSGTADEAIEKCVIHPQLSSNITNVFIYEAVTAASICSLLSVGSLGVYVDSHAQIAIGGQDEVFEKAAMLASLLQVEFPAIRPPCKDFGGGIQGGIDWLKMNDVIEDEERRQGQHLEEKRSRRLANIIDMELHQEAYDEDQVTPSKKLMLNTSKSAIQTLLELRKLVTDSIAQYYHAVALIVSIVDVDYVSEDELINLLGQRCDLDKIPVVLSRLEDMGVIHSGYCVYHSVPNVKVIWLTENWNHVEKLTQLLSKILPYIS